MFNSVVQHLAHHAEHHDKSAQVHHSDFGGQSGSQSIFWIMIQRSCMEKEPPQPQAITMPVETCQKSRVIDMEPSGRC